VDTQEFFFILSSFMAAQRKEVQEEDRASLVGGL